MAGLYALAAAFFASFSVVYVLVCTFTPFLECGWLINARLPPSLAFCIRYYNFTTNRVRGMATLRLGLRVVIAPRKKVTCPGCTVSLAMRTRSSPSLSGSASPRSLGGELGRGLCYVSTFYTTLVWKSQEANGPLELLRKLRPRTRENRGKTEGPEARSCTPSLYSVSSMLAHALKQQVSLPVARLLVLVRTTSQLF